MAPKIPKHSVLTTPLFYVNSRPHLGHAYSLILSDIFSKYNSSKSKLTSKPFSRKVHCFRDFSHNKIITGLDQHGYKIQQSALESSQSTENFVSKNSHYFKSLYSKIWDGENESLLQIETHSKKHKESLHYFWNDLEKSGYIYWDDYEGWYSIIDEAFYTKQDIQINSEGKTVAKSSQNEVEFTREYSCKFNLLAFKDFLIDWLSSGNVFVQSKYQVEWLRKSLEYAKTINQDITLTRPVNRVHWGIGVPEEEKYTIYVWLDALVGYLTACGYPNDKNWTDLWPAEMQIFGKDILKFHSIIWPALLKAVNLPLPKKLVCHSHILCNNVKMSKSLGNTIDCLLELDVLGSDAIRLHLASLPLLSVDCSYSRSLCISSANELLSNKLGNLLSRISSKSLNPNVRYFEISQEDAHIICTASKEGLDLFRRLDSFSSVLNTFWNDLALHKIILEINKLLDEANIFFNHCKPWKMQPGDERDAILGIIFEVINHASQHLYPICPKTAVRLSDRLDNIRRGKINHDEKFILTERINK